MIGDTLSALELQQLNGTLLQAFSEYGKNIGPHNWAWPGGAQTLNDSYLFTTSEGLLVVGPYEEDSRWWYGISLLDELPTSQLVPIFEFNVPKSHNQRVSLQFRWMGETGIAVLHSGRFTVGRGAVSPDVFFEYYDAAAGSWPVIQNEDRSYLHLFTFDLDRLRYSQFYSFIHQAALFADYVTFFKDDVRKDKQGR